MALTEPPIDPANELIHDRSQVLILLHIAATGNGNLDEYNLSNPLRVLVEENFESVKLLGNTLDVVETVNADDEFDTLELLLELRDTFLDGGFGETLGKLFRVDTDRECADCTEFAFVLDAVGGGRETPIIPNQRHNHHTISDENLQDPATTRQKVPSIVERMKS